MTQKFSLVVILFLSISLLSPPIVPLSSPAPPVADNPYLPPKGYVCYRAHQPIEVDGRIDEDEWKDAPWSDPFEDIEGDKRPKPRYRTRVKMLWDDQNLYIAAQLEEPHVWGTLRQHDSVIFKDNDFEVFIDPDGDNHLYGELELNALNTTWDLLLSKPYKDQGKAIDAWEITGLRTAVHVDGTLNDPSDTDRGWSVEIAWPWKSLLELTNRPIPPADGDQWRINFSRVEWEHSIVAGQYRKVKGKREENWVWSPQGVIDMHRPETWGYLQFSTGTPGSVAFRPDPVGPARHTLHRVYYAQKAFFMRHGRFATTLKELQLDALQKERFAPIKLQVTDHDFEASLKLRTPDGRMQNWYINSESHIRKD